LDPAIFELVLIEFSTFENIWKADLFARLRWNVFGDIGNIKVNSSTNGTPAIESLAGHPIAEENVTEPPVSRIEVSITVLNDKSANDEQEEEDRYWPPLPLLLETEDGSAIKVRDFVTKVHAYLNENKEAVIQAMGELLGEEIDLEDGWKAIEVGPELDDDNFVERACYIFDGVQENHKDPMLFRVSVEIWADGEDGQTAEEHWQER
jgi:hypothetical protein